MKVPAHYQMRLPSFIRSLALPLTLGAISSVAIAWLLAAFSGWGDPRIGTAILAPRGSKESSVVVHQASQPGSLLRHVVIVTHEVSVFDASAQPTLLPYSRHNLEVFGPDDVDDSWGLARRALILRDESASGVERAFGWPLPAAYWRHDADGTPTGGAQLRLPGDDPWGKGDRFLPTLPIWRGLILNTVLYAGAWWLLFAVPRHLRRVGRRRRGVCPTCGYAIADLPRCPECGWASHTLKSTTPTVP